jgi:hypothetical protein
MMISSAMTPSGSRTLLPVLVLIGLWGAACSTSNDVVGDGPFQKRKYRKGWHVDVRSTGDTRTSAAPARTGDRSAINNEPSLPSGNVAEPKVVAELGPGGPTADLEPTVDVVVPPPADPAPAVPRSTEPADVVPVTRVAMPEMVTTVGEDTPRPMNQTAIAALVFAIMLPPVGIYLAVVATKQIEKSGERGGGLAAGALILGILFSLAIVLALLASGMSFSL